MIPDILLKQSPTDKPQRADRPIAWVHGDNGYIAIGPVQIGGPADRLADLLRALADALAADPDIPLPAINAHPWDRVLTMTPADVVAYFRQSPVLRAWADLVAGAPAIAEALKADEAAHDGRQGLSREERDRLAIAHLKNPSQADVAEALFKDRTKTGGGYRRRILRALGLTTTTTREAKKNTTTPKKAA